MAFKLGLGGWIRNDNSDGSVDGQVVVMVAVTKGGSEGTELSSNRSTESVTTAISALEDMKHWLQTVGSPRSSINRAIFQDETQEALMALWESIHRDTTNSDNAAKKEKTARTLDTTTTATTSYRPYFEIRKTVKKRRRMVAGCCQQMNK